MQKAPAKGCKYMHVATQVAKLAIAKVEVRDWDLEVRTNIPVPTYFFALPAGTHLATLVMSPGVPSF